MIVSFFSSPKSSNNVTVGLFISLISALLNLYFFVKSRHIANTADDEMMRVQSKLNFSRLLLDVIVSIVYVVIIKSKNMVLVHRVDLGGSVLVALVTIVLGLQMFFEKESSVRKTE